MNHTPPRPQRYFPHEKLVAYELAQKAVQLVADRRDRLRGLPGQAGPQLERAVVGAHSNLCAGAASSGADARRLFRIARAEASEAGGCADIALAYRALSPGEHAELREILLRLGACLRGLGGR